MLTITTEILSKRKSWRCHDNARIFFFLGIYPNNVISQCYYAGICLLFAHCSTQLFYSVCQQTAQQSVSGQCRV